MLQYSIKNKLNTQEKNDIFLLLEKTNASLLQYPEWVNYTQPGRKNIFITAYHPIKGLIAYVLVSVKMFHGIIWFGPVSSDIDFVPEFCKKSLELIKHNGLGLLSIVNSYSDEVRNKIIFKIADNYKISQKTHTLNWATVAIDLNKSWNELYENFSENNKRSIKKQLNAGFVVRIVENGNDVQALAMIYNKMYKNKKLKRQVKNSSKMFLNIQHFFKETSKGVIMGIFNKDILIGGVVIGYHGKTAFYHMGASNNDIKNMPVMHLLFFEIIKFLKSKGFDTLDMGGYSLDNVNNKQLININRFKLGFGGNIITYSKPIHIVISLTKFNIINYIKPLIFKGRNLFKQN